MNDMTRIEPTHPHQPTGATVAILVIAMLAAIVIILALGLGALDSFAGGPHLTCTIGAETVFHQPIDNAIETSTAITITLAGHTSVITPPAGGECHVTE